MNWWSLFDIERGPDWDVMLVIVGVITLLPIIGLIVNEITDRKGRK